MRAEGEGRGGGGGGRNYCLHFISVYRTTKWNYGRWCMLTNSPSLPVPDSLPSANSADILLAHGREHERALVHARILKHGRIHKYMQTRKHKEEMVGGLMTVHH